MELVIIFLIGGEVFLFMCLIILAFLYLKPKCSREKKLQEDVNEYDVPMLQTNTDQSSTSNEYEVIDERMQIRTIVNEILNPTVVDDKNCENTQNNTVPKRSGIIYSGRGTLNAEKMKIYEAIVKEIQVKLRQPNYGLTDDFYQMSKDNIQL